MRIQITILKKDFLVTSYNENKHQLIIGKRRENLPGMLTKRVFNVIWITKSKQRELNFENKPDAVINYNGDEIIIKQRQ